MLLTPQELKAYCHLPSDESIDSGEARGIAYSEKCFEVLWTRVQGECLNKAEQLGISQELLIETNADEIKKQQILLKDKALNDLKEILDEKFPFYDIILSSIIYFSSEERDVMLLEELEKETPRHALIKVLYDMKKDAIQTDEENDELLKIRQAWLDKVLKKFENIKKQNDNIIYAEIITVLQTYSTEEKTSLLVEEVKKDHPRRALIEILIEKGADIHALDDIDTSAVSYIYQKNVDMFPNASWKNAYTKDCIKTCGKGYFLDKLDSMFFDTGNNICLKQESFCSGNYGSIQAINGSSGPYGCRESSYGCTTLLEKALEKPEPDYEEIKTILEHYTSEERNHKLSWEIDAVYQSHPMVIKLLMDMDAAYITSDKKLIKGVSFIRQIWLDKTLETFIDSLFSDFGKKERNELYETIKMILEDYYSPKERTTLLQEEIKSTKPRSAFVEILAEMGIDANITDSEEINTISQIRKKNADEYLPIVWKPIQERSAIILNEIKKETPNRVLIDKLLKTGIDEYATDEDGTSILTYAIKSYFGDGQSWLWNYIKTSKVTYDTSGSGAPSYAEFENLILMKEEKYFLEHAIKEDIEAYQLFKELFEKKYFL